MEIRSVFVVTSAVVVVVAAAVAHSRPNKTMEKRTHTQLRACVFVCARNSRKLDASRWRNFSALLPALTNLGCASIRLGQIPILALRQSWSSNSMHLSAPTADNTLRSRPANSALKSTRSVGRPLCFVGRRTVSERVCSWLTRVFAQARC